MIPFQRFLDDTRDDVWRFLVAAVGRQEADDCFQETFTAALAAYPKVAADSNLRAWILTIASRKAIDHHRARARAPIPVPDPPESIHEDSHADDAIWARVRLLPDKQRGAVLLRYAGDLTHREVGRALGCSEEAARRNTHEGLRRLRDELAQDPADEEVPA